MSGQLPTLILVMGGIVGGIVLLNPELRCSLLNICGGGGIGQKPPEDEPETPPPPPKEEEEEEDDDGNPVNVTYNINNPPPVILNPPPPIYYPGPRGPQIVRYASNGCCECKTHSDGIVRCRTKPYGYYTISYRSAKYNVIESARLCAKNKCKKSGGIFGGIFDWGDRDRDRDRDWDRDDNNHKPKPSPPRCPTQISKNGRKYYLTNLTRLPDFQTMQFPPTYIKEGNCIYQLVSSPAPAPAPTPTPTPTPTPSNPNSPIGKAACDNHLCKSYPWLCPHCKDKSNFAQSLFTTTRVAI